MILQIIGFTSLYICLIVWCCCDPDNNINENNVQPPTVVATAINQL